jgi:hypothetical protein
MNKATTESPKANKRQTRKAKALSGIFCKKVKTDKRQNYSDKEIKRLYFRVDPNGTKAWFYRYVPIGTGKRKLKQIGLYPAVSLSEARTRAEEMNRRFAKNECPAKWFDKQFGKVKFDTRKSFKAIAEKYITEKLEPEIKNKKDVKQIRSYFELYAYPFIGSTSIDALTHDDFEQIYKQSYKQRDKNGNVIDQKEKFFEATTDTFQKFTYRCSSAMRYGFTVIKRNDLKLTNPADWHWHKEGFPNLNKLREQKKKHHRTLDNYKDALSVLDKIKNNKSLTKIIDKNTAWKRPPLLFSLFTNVRIGAVIKAKTEHINLRKKEWLVPPEEDKNNEFQIAPLSEQSLELAKAQIKFASDYGSPYLFPSDRNSNKHVSDTTVRNYLYQFIEKDKLTLHGFRSIVTAWALDSYSSSLIEGDSKRLEMLLELQLHHTYNGQSSKEVHEAYYRTSLLKQRRALNQSWCDWLDGLEI